MANIVIHLLVSTRLPLLGDLLVSVCYFLFQMYSIEKIAKQLDMEGAFVLGAGAGHYQHLGAVSEVRMYREI